MIKSFFKRKLCDLKHRYGQHEANYFALNPYCEKCPERRIAALTVHHIKGRSNSEVQTLCFNCHMILHSPNSGEWTYEDEMRWERRQKAKIRLQKYKDRKMFNAYNKIRSLRAVGRQFGVTHVTVKNAIERCQIDNGTSC